MAETTGFLSYTRKDDEFLDGYVASFREKLESAVHFVTGERTFRLFRDREGIVIGEPWQKKLADVIDVSSVFVPIVTPLFLTSGPCRDEVDLFLTHERRLGRDDLVLPLYFRVSPKLEKAEEREKDAVAAAIAARNMFDWRKTVHQPLRGGAARKALLALAEGIGAALERLRARPSGGPGEREALADPPAPRSLAEAAPRILWADDRPENNLWERRALEAYGIRVRIAHDTDAAVRLARRSRYDAVISDLGRPGDPEAGLTLLRHLRGAGRTMPYFVYTTAAAATRLGGTAGLDGATADPDRLVAMILDVVR